MVVVVWVIGAILGLLVLSIGAGRIQMQRQTDREIDALLARGSRSRQPITESDLAGLPAPVARWMRWSGVVGSPPAAFVRLRQSGRFQMEGRGWFPFSADQYFTTSPPVFLWRVKMTMLPLVAVYGLDRYQDRTGGMQMKVLSLIPVVNKTGGGLDQGALLRYLGETIWFPSGALAPFIKWEEIEADSAKATMDYGGTVASAVFYIDAEGRPARIEAERYNDSREKLLPWIAESTRYGEFAGIRMPIAGTGSWLFEDGKFTYIDWRITDVDFNVAERY